MKSERFVVRFLPVSRTNENTFPATFGKKPYTASLTFGLAPDHKRIKHTMRYDVETSLVYQLLVHGVRHTRKPVS